MSAGVSKQAKETTADPNSWRWLWTILAIAFFIRLIVFIQFLNSPLAGLYRADHAFYRNWARQIAAGQWSLGSVFEQGPLYAYLVAGFYRLFGVNDSLLLMLQLSSGLIVVWLVHRVGELAFNTWTARIAALMTACYGPLIYYECLVMKAFLTPLLCLVIAESLVQLVQTQSTSQRQRILWLLRSSFATGALCLIRENYILLLPLIMGVAITTERTRSARILAAILPGIVLLGCTLPATIHNKLVSGDWVWVTSGGGEVLAMSWAPESAGYYLPPPFIRADPTFEHEDFRLEASRRLGHPVSYRESSAFWAREGLREIGRDPGHAARLAFQKLLIAINDFEVPDSEFFEVAQTRIPLLQVLPTFGWVSSWGLIGILLTGCFQRPRFIVLSMIGVHLLSIMLTYNFARFRIGMTPFWILFAAFTIVVIVQNLISSQPRLQLLALGGIACGSLLCLFSFLPPPAYQSTGYAEMADGFQAFLDERRKLLEDAKSMAMRHETLSLPEKQHLAELYFAAHADDRAEQELKHIVQQEPGQTKALMQLAILHGKRGDFLRAEALLKRALQIQSDDAALWANLGNCYFHQALSGTIAAAQRERWLKLARKAYTRGLEIAPQDPVCRTGLAGVEQSLDRD